MAEDGSGSPWQDWPPPADYTGWLWTTREIGSRVHGNNRFERPRPMLVTIEHLDQMVYELGKELPIGGPLASYDGQVIHLPDGQIVLIARLRFDLWAPMIPPPPLEQQA